MRRPHPLALILGLLALSLSSCGDGGGEGTATTADRLNATTTERSGDAVDVRNHQDSGGGSEQFRVDGGDNSIQEFGSEASRVEFEQAAAALHGFLDARAAGMWASACGYLAAGVVESFRRLAAQGGKGEDLSCASLLEKLTNKAAMQELRAEAAQADVGSLRIEGKRGFVLYRGIGGVVITIPMTREGDRWKVATLNGVPLS
jgi:hypothetical protein